MSLSVSSLLGDNATSESQQNLVLMDVSYAGGHFGSIIENMKYKLTDKETVKIIFWYINKLGVEFTDKTMQKLAVFMVKHVHVIKRMKQMIQNTM